MKYGMYLYDSPTVNYGDYMQLIACEHIYEKLGVSKNEIIHIPLGELGKYDGEPVILPVFSITKSSICAISVHDEFSENIEPVFISFVKTGSITTSEAEYLKRHEPIGCRDAYTLRECLRHGINAHLNGCITVCLPKRPDDILGNKVFLIDSYSELSQHMPESIKREAEHLTHVTLSDTDHSCIALKEARRLLERYKNEAKLVVTSRLHAAVPCIALGIPTIIVRQHAATTFQWIDKIVPIYEQPQFAEIDWNPKPVNIEEHKKDILNLACMRIKNAKEVKKLSEKINNFYSEREVKEISMLTPFSETLKTIEQIKYDKNETFTYSLWGCRNFAWNYYEFMRFNYPNAKLAHLYDKNLHGMVFYGLTIEPFENIENNTDDFLVVCPVTPEIVDEMQSFLDKIKRPEGTYVTVNTKILFNI